MLNKRLYNKSHYVFRISLFHSTSLHPSLSLYIHIYITFSGYISHESTTAVQKCYVQPILLEYLSKASFFQCHVFFIKKLNFTLNPLSFMAKIHISYKSSRVTTCFLWLYKKHLYGWQMSQMSPLLITSLSPDETILSHRTVNSLVGLLPGDTKPSVE